MLLNGRGFCSTPTQRLGFGATSLLLTKLPSLPSLPLPPPFQVETTLALDNFRRACDCGRGAVFFRCAQRLAGRLAF